MTLLLRKAFAGLVHACLKAGLLGVSLLISFMALPALAQPLQDGSYTFTITTSDPVDADGECDFPANNDPECSHVLDTLTVGGTTYTAFTTPTTFAVNGYVNAGNIQSRIYNDIGDFVFGMTPNYETEMLTNVFSDADLNAYQQVDSTGGVAGSFDFAYAAPIPATSDFFVMITERLGNNTQFVEAFDNLGVSMGTVECTANSNDYSDTGRRVHPTQNGFLCVVPLDNFADATDPSRRVGSFRLSNIPGRDDGGDHVVFVFGNIVPPNAVDDEDLNNPVGTDVQIDILSNDTDADGDAALPTTVTVDLDPVAPGIQTTLDVIGEGDWTYNPATGELEFVPEPTFTGDPGVITYELTDDVTGGTDTATVTITYVDPELTLVKSVVSVADTNMNGVIGDEGDTITYSFEVTNTGNTSVADLELTDDRVGLTNFSLTPDALAPNDSVTLTGQTYVILDTDEAAGQVVNTATVTGVPVATTAGGAPDPAAPLGLPDVDDTSDTGTEPTLNPDGTPVAVPGDPADDDTDGTPGNDGDEPTVVIIPAGAGGVPGGFTLTKTVDDEIVQRGTLVSYTIVLTNNTAVAATGIDLVDTLPDGLIYIDGSAELDGVPAAVTLNGQVVTFSGVDVAPGASVVATLNARILNSTNPGEYVNTVLALDPPLGLVLAGPAMASVRILPEAVFDCSDVIGRVFDDLDGDGYQDAYDPNAIADDSDPDGKIEDVDRLTDEVGLPNVRLVTLDGLIITTDQNGLFSVPCAALPADNGSNFLLSLDERTLPLGYEMTTQNPRVMRLTSGTITEMNFGARLEQTMRVDLGAAAFQNGAVVSTEMRNAVAAMVARLSEEPSTVELVFHIDANAGANDVAFARAAMEALSSEIQSQWGSVGSGRLQIEQVIARGGN